MMTQALRVASKFILSYDYSSVQYDFPMELSKEIYQWGLDNIPDSELNPEEDKARQPVHDIHVTVKYGLHTKEASGIKKLLQHYKPFKVKLGLISIFEPEDKGDVIKIDVESDGLHALNKLIKDNFVNSDTYPEYHPHITIAYVKKGDGAKYAGNPAFKDKEVMAGSVVFSGLDDSKTVIKFHGGSI